MPTEPELYPRLLIRGMTWRIESFPFQVGRDPQCALRIDDPYLSRVQLQVERGAAGYALLALGQAQVKVNGKIAQGRVPLTSGDTLAVHGFVATFLAPTPSAVVAPPELPFEIVAEISRPSPADPARTAPAGSTGRVGSSRVPTAVEGAGGGPARAGSSRVPTAAANAEGAPTRHRGSTTKRTRIVHVGGLRWRGRSAAALGGWLAIAAAAVGGYALARAVGPSWAPEERRPIARLQPVAPTTAAAAEAGRTEGSPVPRRPEPNPRQALPPKAVAPPAEPAPPDEVKPAPDTDPGPPSGDPEPPDLTPPRNDPRETEPTAPPEAPRKRHPLDVDEGEEEVEWRGGFGSGSGKGEGGSIAPPEEPEGGGKYRDIPILGEEIRAKKIAFVIDRSGSMAKEWWSPVRTELSTTLGMLTPDHQFNLYLFSNVYDDYARGWARGTPDEIAKAVSWIGGIEAKGATDPVPPLLAALALPGIEALVLLSDIRYKGAKMDEAIALLTRATRGTRTFKPIKLYYFPVEITAETARISALASGKPAEALKLRLTRR